MVYLQSLLIFFCLGFLGGAREANALSETRKSSPFAENNFRSEVFWWNECIQYSALLHWWKIWNEVRSSWNEVRSCCFVAISLPSVTTSTVPSGFLTLLNSDSGSQFHVVSKPILIFFIFLNVQFVRFYLSHNLSKSFLATVGSMSCLVWSTSSTFRRWQVHSFSHSFIHSMWEFV